MIPLILKQKYLIEFHSHAVYIHIFYTTIITKKEVSNIF